MTDTQNISTTQDRMKLIKLVESNPCLYNTNLFDYSSRQAVDQAWDSIAREFDVIPSKCKEAWRKLRTSYARNLKNSHQKGGACKKYYLHENLKFLIPFLTTVPTSDDEDKQSEQINLDPELEYDGPFKVMDSNNVPYQESDEDSVYRDVKPCKRRRSQAPDFSHRKMFLLSLLPDVEELSNEQMRSFKLKVSSMLNDMLSDK